MPQILPVIGAVVGIAGTVMSTRATIEAAEAQTEAAQEQTNIAIAGNRISNYNQTKSMSAERRKAVRQEQIVRAQALSSAGAAGAIGSSSVAGGIGSLSSEVGGALGVQQSQNNIAQLGSGIQTAGAQRIGALNVQAQNAQNRAAIWGAASSLGMTAFNVGGGYAGIQAWNQSRKTAQG